MPVKASRPYPSTEHHLKTKENHCIEETNIAYMLLCFILNSKISTYITQGQKMTEKFILRGFKVISKKSKTDFQGASNIQES